jgi:malate synthase
MTTASPAFDPSRLPSGVEIKGGIKPGYERVLTPEALAFVADLARRF